MKLLKLCRQSLLALLFLGLTPAATAEVPNIVVSIKPIHSLVEGVLGDRGQADLILPDGVSPHEYRVRPSAMQKMHRSDLLIWLGPAMEQVMISLARSLPDKIHKLGLLELPNLELLQAREGGIHQHGHHHAEVTRMDPHIWLHPGNAVAMLDAIEQQLSVMDPDNSYIYRANASDMRDRIEALDHALRAQLADSHNTNYVVYHDAFAYFMHHYGLNEAASVAAHAGRQSSAKRISEIRELLKQGNACLFHEPDNRPPLIDTLTEGLDVYVGTLDPLGSGIAAGPDAWFEIMQQVADQLSQCNPS